MTQLAILALGKHGQSNQLGSKVSQPNLLNELSLMKDPNSKSKSKKREQYPRLCALMHAHRETEI